MTTESFSTAAPLAAPVLSPITRCVLDSLVRTGEGAHLLEAGLAEPQRMSQGTFLSLQQRAEFLGMENAQGHDCRPGFDTEAAEVARLLDAAPWTLHPDYGCVLSADVAALDLAPSP